MNTSKYKLILKNQVYNIVPTNLIHHKNKDITLLIKYNETIATCLATYQESNSNTSLYLGINQIVKHYAHEYEIVFNPNNPTVELTFKTFYGTM